MKMGWRVIVKIDRNEDTVKSADYWHAISMQEASHARKELSGGAP